jgi:hypothetical protein
VKFHRLCGRRDHAVDVVAQRRRLVELYERDEGGCRNPVLLQVHRDLLLLGRIGLLREVITQPLNLGVAS